MHGQRGQPDRSRSFPTVPFPNPEEDGALHLGMMAAENNGRKLLIANDPDADCFAMAHIIPESADHVHFATGT
jgi:phosphoglucomutase